MIPDPEPVDPTRLIKIGQQPIEQGDVAAGGEGQMQIGALGGGGAAGVDDDDFCPVRGAGGHQALMQYRVAPGGVAADQDDQIGFLPVLIHAGDDILAEGTDVTGDGGRHAETGIGVDVGAADEALHQFVGGVVILGQALAGDVEGDAVRPVRGDGLFEPRGDQAHGVVP